ncbi:MAG: hypothetical protein RQ847_04835 [Wenzhouxiangellaceae bacterium]|nr:hypothetical protein [Wenzhouxiangellaceae bacterium]
MSGGHRPDDDARHRRRIRATVLLLAGTVLLIYIGFIARGVLGG